MKKRLSALIILITFNTLLISQLSACNEKKDAAVVSTESNSVNVSINSNKQSGEAMSHVSVEQSNGPGKEFSTIPLYYQQDYYDIPYRDKSVAEYGSLITCLSMLESYYKAEFVTPDLYLTSHDISSASTEEMIEDFANTNDRTINMYDFDAALLGSFLVNEQREVLLYIPHPSVFGNTASYMILTGTTVDGNIYVRDPNQANINIWGTIINGNEPVYDATVICEQASESSKMYVFTENPK